MDQQRLDMLKRWEQERIQGMINRYKEEQEENSKFNILERRALEKFPSGGQRILRNIRNAE
jgi:hypothetical protein